MNEKDIKALKWESDKRIGLGNGLYLNLRKSSKTFIVRIQHSTFYMKGLLPFFQIQEVVEKAK